MFNKESKAKSKKAEAKAKADKREADKKAKLLKAAEEKKDIKKDEEENEDVVVNKDYDNKKKASIDKENKVFACFPVYRNKHIVIRGIGITFDAKGMVLIAESLVAEIKKATKQKIVE